MIWYVAHFNTNNLIQNNLLAKQMPRITAADILKVVPITRKTLWLWQKKYGFFPDPKKEGHPGGKGIIGYYPAWVEDRCKKVYALQKKGYTIPMIKEILEKEKNNNSNRKILVVNDEVNFCNILRIHFGYLKVLCII